MKLLKSHPVKYFIAFLIIGFLLASSQYLQMYKGVNPCPLCVLQRIVFSALGIVFLFGILSSTKNYGRIISAILSLLFSLLGILLAGRQVWIQHLPPSAGENCEASLQYMLSVLPITHVAKNIFAGSTACSQIGWEFLHLSLAQWSLLGFIFFFFFSLWMLFAKPSR